MHVWWLLAGAALAQDADGDGFPAPADCNDADATVFPGAVEVCDGLDDDCDGRLDEGFAVNWYADADGDGFGDEWQVQPTIACTRPPGVGATRDDCDDGDATVHPGAADGCDGTDTDCDRAPDGDAPRVPLWQDRDGDGYGAGPRERGCVAEDAGPGAYWVDLADGTQRLVLDGWVGVATDCDDFDPARSPAAPEGCGDDDCDGQGEACGDSGADADTGPTPATPRGGAGCACDAAATPASVARAGLLAVAVVARARRRRRAW